jgi:hypothetical protein
VGAREFERCFPCLGAAIAKEDAVEAADFCEAEGELGCAFVEEEVRGVEEALTLKIDRFFYRGVTVAQSGDADAAEEVEVVAAIFVAEVNSFSTDKQIGVTLIRVKEKFFLRCLA